MKKCKGISRKVSLIRSYNIYSHFISVFFINESRKKSLKSAHFQKSAHIWINPHGWQHCNTHKAFSKRKKKKTNICSTPHWICLIWWDDGGEVNIK